MKRKHLRHGDIVEIQLPQLKRLAYGKIIDPRKIKNPFEYPCFLRIYNSIHETRVNDVSKLKRELLLAPIWLVGQSTAVTKFGWTIICTEQVNEIEEFIPDTKVGYPRLAKEPERWGYIRRFDTQINFADYEIVKHLDNSSGKNVEIIPFIIELEVLKIKGIDIQEKFGLTNWPQTEYYKEFINQPIYSKLSENLRGLICD